MDRKALADALRGATARVCAECGHPDDKHVAVYSGDTNHLDCTVCGCTIYPKQGQADAALAALLREAR